MKTKVLEIRDEGTFIPVLCIDMQPDNETQRWYMNERCGYPCDGRPNIVMTYLGANGGPAWNDPYAWGGRTRPTAHHYILDHWDELSDGDVVDVSFILGETKAPKVSERIR